MRDLTLAATLDTINVPEDMDALTATTGGADRPIQDPLQGLGNHSLYTRTGLGGQLACRLDVRCDDGTFVAVQPVSSLWINGKVYSRAGTMLTSGTFSGLTTGARTYLYAVVSGSALSGTLEQSSVAPCQNAGYLFKDNGSGSPDLTRRYVGSFVAKDATHAYPFRAINGRVLYRRSAAGLTLDDFALDLDGGTHVAWQSVDVRKFIPEHATHGLIDVEYTPPTGSVVTAEICTKGDGGVAWRASARGVSSGDKRMHRIELPLAGVPLGFDYQVGAGGTVAAFVAGYQE